MLESCRVLPSSPGWVEGTLAESGRIQHKVNPYVTVWDSWESGDPSLTCIPRQIYRQKQTYVYAARPWVTFHYSRYMQDNQWHRNGALQVWVGRDACKSWYKCMHRGVHSAPPPALCCVRGAPAVIQWRSSILVPGSVRPSFQERKVTRTSATAVDKQY